MRGPRYGKPAKFIKRDQMTGQEKYDSDKERKEAEDIAKSKREQAKAEEENAVNGREDGQVFPRACRKQPDDSGREGVTVPPLDGVLRLRLSFCASTCEQILHQECAEDEQQCTKYESVPEMVGKHIF
jgi:hypothetical protein